jgi:hypothetical protein
MDALEQKAIDRADELVHAELGRILIAALDLQGVMQGRVWARDNVPLDVHFTPAQKRGYVAFQREAEYYADVQPAEYRDDYVGV